MCWSHFHGRILCDLSKTYLGNTGLGAESHSKGEIILSIASEGYNQRAWPVSEGTWALVESTSLTKEYMNQ